MKKREPQVYSKKKYTTVSVIGLTAFAISLVFLVIGAILQETGADESAYLPWIIACFAIMFPDVIFLIYHWGGIQMYEIERAMNQAKNGGCEVFDNVNTDIRAYCEANKFTRLNEGYYHRRKFSFQKDYVNYYIQTSYASDVKETIHQLYSRFDGCDYKNGNKCLILFLEKDGVTESDQAALAELASVFIGLETGVQIFPNTSVNVLLDRKTDRAYCVPPGKNKLSFYNIGYKQVKKILYAPGKKGE